MRTLVVTFVVAAVACGGTSTSGGKKSAGGPTCKDASIILAAKGDSKARAPKREAAIAAVCVKDAWPRDVIKCVVGWPEVEDCIVRLTEPQRQRYITARVAAKDVSPDEPVAIEDPIDPDPYLTAMPDPPLPCSAALGDITAYDPPITTTGDDREFSIGLRRIAIEDLCDDGWSDEVRRCFVDGYDVAACRLKLDTTQEQELATRLTENDTLLARLGKVAKKPANIDCKKVVAVHYADATWKGKLDQVKGGARKKMITESRTRMKTACVDEAWSATFRACIVADDSDRCMLAAGLQPSRWGFPAAGVSAGGASTAGLYDRLGGADGVSVIAELLIDQISMDQRINTFFANADPTSLVTLLGDQLCVLAGGPCTYSGRDMRSAHAGMGITQTHVDAFVEDLGLALGIAGIATADRDAVLALYKGMAGDVIAP